MLNNSKRSFWIKRFSERGYLHMAKVHHGGKVGGAAQRLASNSTSKRTKSKAEKIMAVHKAKYY